MGQIVRRCLVVTAVLASVCGSAAAQEAKKDWYVALKLGYQPYQMDLKGEVNGRDFAESASLKDIQDNSDTTILGGEIEAGKGKFFTILSGFYQKSKFDKGNDAPANGAEFTLTETGINALLGYRVYETRFGNGQALLVDATAGVWYVKVEADLDVHRKVVNFDESKDIDFLDPMLGARVYYAITKKFGIAVGGQIGGFGVGSELQYVASGSLVYNFTDWFAMSAGYKYWYFKYEDDDAKLSRLEQTIKGPLVGVVLRF